MLASSSANGRLAPGPSSSSSSSTSASRHHNHPHHVLCNNTTVNGTAASNINIQPRPLMMGGAGSLGGTSSSHAAANLVGGHSSSLPHQLSQLCNSHQYPLLALQQNFNHLLPPNFADAPATTNNNNMPHHHHNSLSHHNHHHHHHHQTHNNLVSNEPMNNQQQHRQRHQHFNDFGVPSGVGLGLDSSSSGSTAGLAASSSSGSLSSNDEPILTHHNRSHHNWRKSKSQNNNYSRNRVGMAPDGFPHSLLDLSAKIVAEHIPFQSIEQRYEHIPEPVQRRIIFWSFPRHEEDIKMYSSLSSDTFNNNGPQSSNSSSSSLNSNTNNNNSSSNNNSNSTTQSSSSSNNNNAFAWIENPAVQQQANPSQTSSNSIVSTTLKNNHHQQKQLTFHKGLRLYLEGCVNGVLQVGFNLSGLVTIKISPTNQSTTGNSKVRNNNNNNHSNNNANNNHHQHQQQHMLQDAQNNIINDILVVGNQNQAPSTSASDNTNHQSSSNIGDLLSRSFRVSVTFDRCKITSVSCSCELQDIFWCEHVVALVLYRIRNPEIIELRVPISETLLSLDRQQLQKLVQYIIAEHHTEVLPTAQRLLDEMRQSYSEINQIHGAPDPTAGACSDDPHIWHLDEYQVNEKVQNYLNLVCGNSKDAAKQIHALFEKIREMFRARDSNGTRLLRLITEQFLLFATRNEKSRPLWDQLVSLWVVVMLNPDLSKTDKNKFVQLLINWSKVVKCPKEDVERRISIKRKAADLSDDEEGDDYTNNMNNYSNNNNDYPMSFNQSNNYPAHMATHRHRTFQSNNSASFPVLRPYNQLHPILPSTCPCQLSHSIAKKMRSHHMQQQHNNSNSNDLTSNSMQRNNNRPSSSSNHHNHHSSHNHNSGSRTLGSSSSSSSSSLNNASENRLAGPQEPRGIFYRALDFQDSTWNDSHLQLVLNKDGPVHVDQSPLKSNSVDCRGNPLWNESISQAAARVETLRCHGYREQALRLAVATVRRLKLYQDQWCHVTASESNMDISCISKGIIDNYNEAWIGHPFDPINVLVDILLEASLTESPNTFNTTPATGTTSNGLCAVNSARCTCPFNQVLADFTHRLLPDLTSLSSYSHRVDGFPILPLVNLAPRRLTNPSSQSSHASDKTPYYHVPVPGCCQKDSYLTLAVELALIAMGQQRTIPTIATAHDRAVRQEAELISKLESIDTSNPLLIDILKHQTTLLLEGGPFQNSCCGIPTDSAPLHTFARYLFDSLVSHYPQLAYKVGVYALKMPLQLDENSENFGAARTTPRSINHNHLQSEQLALAQTMLSTAKDEAQQKDCLRKVYRASIKNIRNPASLLKLSKHVHKEAKPNGTTLHPALLRTSFDLGLQVLRATQSPQTSNSKTRRDAISFIVECATDIGLDAVLQVMKDSRDYFSPTEALSLVVLKETTDHRDRDANLRTQAMTKLKIKESPMKEQELNRRAYDLVLDCANRDPSNCALEAVKFCETNEESLKKALKIVMDAGANRRIDSSRLIQVADHIHSDRDMTNKAFEIAMVAVDSLLIQANSDNSSLKKDIFSACDYAQKVNGFSTLIPKLINNIECATVLSDIYHRFSPSTNIGSSYRNYGNDLMATYRNNLGYSNDLINNLLNNSKSSDLYKQSLEDARWWAALLKRTLKAFVDTTRTRLLNISPRHYAEFIDFLSKAQGTFEKAADGPQQFKNLISEIMKSYRTKKKLMERLKTRFDCSIK